MAKMILVGMALSIGGLSVASSACGGEMFPVEFAFPVDCELGDECFLAALVDQEAGPGVLDHRCGTMSYDGHTGTDIALRGFAEMDAGVDVRASADGVVIDLSTSGQDRFSNACAKARGDDNYVWIEHADGGLTYYGHLRARSMPVAVGDVVMAGEKIGEVGAAGDPCWPHLHFEIRDADFSVVDPFSGRCGSDLSRWARPPTVGGDARVLDGGVERSWPDAGSDWIHEAAIPVDGAVFAWARVANVKAGGVSSFAVMPAHIVVAVQHARDSGFAIVWAEITLKEAGEYELNYSYDGAELLRVVFTAVE